MIHPSMGRGFVLIYNNNEGGTHDLQQHLETALMTVVLRCSDELTRPCY